MQKEIEDRVHLIAFRYFSEPQDSLGIFRVKQNQRFLLKPAASEFGKSVELGRDLLGVDYPPAAEKHDEPWRTQDFLAFFKELIDRLLQRTNVIHVEALDVSM